MHAQRVVSAPGPAVRSMVQGPSPPFHLRTSATMGLLHARMKRALLAAVLASDLMKGSNGSGTVGTGVR